MQAHMVAHFILIMLSCLIACACINGARCIHTHTLVACCNVYMTFSLHVAQTIEQHTMNACGTIIWDIAARFCSSQLSSCPLWSFHHEMQHVSQCCTFQSQRWRETIHLVVPGVLWKTWAWWGRSASWHRLPHHVQPMQWPSLNMQGQKCPQPRLVLLVLPLLCKPWTPWANWGHYLHGHGLSIRR